MQPKRFRAATLEAAYEQVRDDLGADAVILSTQSIRAGGVLGVGARAEVEVLATLPAEPTAAGGFADANGLDPLETDLLGHDLARYAAEADAVGGFAPEPELAPPFLNSMAGSARRGDTPPADRPAAISGPFDAYLRAQVTAAAGFPAADADGVALPFAPAADDARRPSGASAPPLPPPPGGAYGDAAPPPARSTDAESALASQGAAQEGATQGGVTQGGVAQGAAALHHPASDAAQYESAPAAETRQEPEPRIVERSTPEAGPSELFPVPPAAAHDPAIEELRERLSTLDRAVGRIERHVVTEALARGPEALRALQQALTEAGMRPEALLPVLDRVADSLAPEATPQAVAAAVERRLAAQLPAVVRPDLSRRPHAIVLAGPAGSGRTTAAARLARQLGAAHDLRVVLAGADVERAGAPQQLEAIGLAAGVETRPCYTPADLQALLSEQDIDLVIVDTAGQSGRRRDRMAELSAFLRVVPNRTLLLTLPATMQGPDLLRTTEALAPLDPAGLLLTRCDEASAFGAAYSAAFASGLGVAWTAHSGQIGDPLRPGDHHALAGAAVRGAWERADTRAGSRAGARSGARAAVGGGRSR